MKKFEGKVVAITGAGGVICGGLSEHFASLGAKIALLDLRQESGQKVADGIIAKGGIAKAYACNVLDENVLKEVHEAIVRDLGKVDILINGAGGNSPKATTDDEFYDPNAAKSFLGLDKSGFEFVFSLNMMGTFLPSKEFLPDLIENKGSVLNISSMNSFTPLTKIPAYSGAKAAVSNFTKWLATYLAKTGVRVNAIAPGFFLTAQNHALMFDENGNPSERSKKILNNTPMGRFGEKEELYGASEFLVSPEASFITGVVLPIDGGFAAYSGV